MEKIFFIKIYGYIINHFLRIWDFSSSQRADHLIANSEETKKRIEKFYRRNSTVIYPPVDIPNKIERLKNGNYFLTVSRLARAKHIDILIKAANKAKLHLKVVGAGKDEEYLRSIAGPTVEFLGNLSDIELKRTYVNAKAFLFASRDEEFGIAPVEAMGYGLPVIAFRSGGLPEYVVNGKNGYLYDELEEDHLIQRVNELTNLSKEKYLEMRKEARKTAERFSEENFKKNILNFVRSKTNARTA